MKTLFPIDYVKYYLIVPRHGKPLGGGGGIEMLGVHVSVYVSSYCDNFRFHAPIYTIFDPVMHTTIALDEFEDE